MDRKKILSFVESLLSKTIENGCTEAEALAAASKVNELLKKYDISFSEISQAKKEMSEDKYGTLPIKFDDGSYSDIEGLIVAVAQYYDTRVWLVRTEAGPVVNLFGTKQDVIFAKRTILLMYSVFESEYELFEIAGKRRNGRSKPNQKYWASKRASFSLGFCNRITERYRLLKADRNNAAKKSNELVVIKQEIISREIAKIGKAPEHGAQANPQDVEIEDVEAYKKGRESGDRAPIETRGGRISEDKKLEMQA